VTAHAAIILSMARKYVWWKTPEEAAQFPRLPEFVTSAPLFDDFRGA